MTATKPALVIKVGRRPLDPVRRALAEQEWEANIVPLDREHPTLLQQIEWQVLSFMRALPVGRDEGEVIGRIVLVGDGLRKVFTGRERTDYAWLDLPGGRTLGSWWVWRLLERVRHCHQSADYTSRQEIADVLDVTVEHRCAAFHQFSAGEMGLTLDPPGTADPVRVPGTAYYEVRGTMMGNPIGRFVRTGSTAALGFAANGEFWDLSGTNHQLPDEFELHMPAEHLHEPFDPTLWSVSQLQAFPQRTTATAQPPDQGGEWYKIERHGPTGPLFLGYLHVGPDQGGQRNLTWLGDELSPYFSGQSAPSFFPPVQPQVEYLSFRSWPAPSGSTYHRIDQPLMQP